MKAQEEAVYREIQRNTKQAIKTIEAMWDKVYDSDLSMHISKQSLKYAQINGEATQALLDGKVQPVRENYLDDLKLKAGLYYHTLLNTSTAHVAELMIKERNDAMLTMEKVLKKNDEAGEKPKALAKEFMEFQQKSVKLLKDYL